MKLFIVIVSLLFIVSVYSQCADTSSNCANWNANGFCTSSFYTAAQKAAYCGQTCGLCGPTTTTNSTSTCVDNSTSCGTWVANGFCNNTLYTTAQKQQYCAKSCNLCSNSSSNSTTSTDSATSNSTSTSSTCVDSNSACSSLAANGFCASTLYTTAQKQSLCAKSCNLC